GHAPQPPPPSGGPEPELHHLSPWGWAARAASISVQFPGDVVTVPVTCTGTPPQCSNWRVTLRLPSSTTPRASALGSACTPSAARASRQPLTAASSSDRERFAAHANNSSKATVASHVAPRRTGLSRVVRNPRKSNRAPATTD